MIKVNGQTVDIGRFPDGTFLAKVFTPETDITISWFYESDAELASVMYLTKHFRAHGAKYICLFMPYIPNARQDRVKTCDDIFTLKYFAEFINSLKFDKVVVLDPHSTVSEALFDNIQILSPKPYIEKVYNKVVRSGKYQNEHGVTKFAIFYPDEGAMKRYSTMFPTNHCLFGIKKRDWATGKIEGLEVSGDTEVLDGATVLIIDDICSRGGTFYHSAKKLKELGVKNIVLYITHCENTIHEGEIFTSGLIDRVYTTNSIITKPHKDIEVIEL